MNKSLFDRIWGYEYWATFHRKCGDDISVTWNSPHFLSLKKKKYTYYADPFLFKYKGELWLFYEKMPWYKRRGELWCSPMSDVNKEYMVLREHCHLSYPNIFVDDGKILMMPESSELGKLVLYECITFPTEWKVNRILLNGEHVDSNIYKLNGTYYIFTYKKEHLYIYKMENDLLTGIPQLVWQTHDVKRNLRGAGNLYDMNGLVIRPSQKCDTRYGAGLLFNKINSDRIKLLTAINTNTDTLSDECDCKHMSDDQIFLIDEGDIITHDMLFDNRNIIGMHTYNKLDNIEVVDILIRGYGLFVPFRKVIKEILKRI